MGFHINMNGSNPATLDKCTFVRGAAFGGTSTSDLVSLPEYFNEVQSRDDFKSLLTSLNGYFCIICKRGSALFAAVDRARSIPLFYGYAGDEFYISDDANWVRERVGSLERSELAKYEFCMTGYVTGSDTLCPDVKQLRAGELLVVELCGKALRFDIERYYDLVSTEAHYPSDAEELSEAFDQVLVRCFERLVTLANGRTIAIPLSGGWDSRLIALMLTRLGYGNVVAFTYGRPGNLESEISKRVANTLGIEWHFVPYSNELWKQWFWTDERSSYYSLAHNLVSLPHIQDWPAVWELKKKELIPADCVFVPGHTGDFLAGTTGIPKSFLEPYRIPSTRVVEEIYDGHYCLRRCDGERLYIKEAMKQRISAQLGSSGDLCADDAIRLYKRWVWQERQAKFIVNSVRVYDFWGHDWWIPLGDLEMREFWMRVPIELRFDKRLYIAYIKQLSTQIVGAGNADFRRTERDTVFNYVKEAAKRTPLRSLIVNVGRKLKRETQYENNSLATYGVMSKETFLKYYDMEFGGINAYLAAHAIGLVDLS